MQNERKKKNPSEPQEGLLGQCKLGPKAYLWAWRWPGKYPAMAPGVHLGAAVGHGGWALVALHSCCLPDVGTSKNFVLQGNGGFSRPW